MLHVTHKSCVKWVGVALLVIASFMAVSVSSTANAQTTDLHITSEVRNAVACFAFARAQNLGHDVLDVYLKRIGKASGSAGAVYYLGYSEGMVDAYGFANASKLGGVKPAKLHAAINMYKLMGCTLNVSI